VTSGLFLLTLLSCLLISLLVMKVVNKFLCLLIFDDDCKTNDDTKNGNNCDDDCF